MYNPPKANFLDAHHRHREDGEFLFLSERWAGADQLFGYSAECGLKAAMKKLGMKIDDLGSPKNPKYRKHVDELWLLFVDFAATSNTKWLIHELPKNEPFNDWSAAHRYASRTYFRKRRVRPHRDATLAITSMIQKMEIEYDE